MSYDIFKDAFRLGKAILGQDDDFDDDIDDDIDDNIDDDDVVDDSVDIEEDYGLDATHSITFGKTFEGEKRDRAAFELMEKLRSKNIYIPGGVTHDSIGGLTPYSTSKVEEKLTTLRIKGELSNSDFNYLDNLLKKASASKR